MATRTRYSIVKCGTSTDAHKLIGKAQKGMPGPFPGGSRWGDSRYLVRPRKLSALSCSDAVIMADDAWSLASEMARLADCAHLELRVQESNHWDFTLYKGKDLIADFSTNVLYFDADEAARRPWKQGDAR